MQEPNTTIMNRPMNITLSTTGGKVITRESYMNDPVNDLIEYSFGIRMGETDKERDARLVVKRESYMDDPVNDLIESSFGIRMGESDEERETRLETFN